MYTVCADRLLSTITSQLKPLGKVEKTVRKGRRTLASMHCQVEAVVQAVRWDTLALSEPLHHLIRR